MRIELSKNIIRINSHTLEINTFNNLIRILISEKFDQETIKYISKIYCTIFSEDSKYDITINFN